MTIGKNKFDLIFPSINRYILAQAKDIKIPIDKISFNSMPSLIWFVDTL